MIYLRPERGRFDRRFVSNLTTNLPTIAASRRWILLCSLKEEEIR
jgi:hypothetical protein